MLVQRRSRRIGARNNRDLRWVMNLPRQRKRCHPRRRPAEKRREREGGLELIHRKINITRYVTRARTGRAAKTGPLYMVARFEEHTLAVWCTMASSTEKGDDRGKGGEGEKMRERSGRPRARDAHFGHQIDIRIQ